jgi:dTDP-4-dehydrorhamnose 3,5-epimerase
VFDVAIDLRIGSPTFCQWFGIELDEESGRMLYIPEGCAHGCLTLVNNTDLMYHTSVPYAPNSATGVRYDDPAFNIVWPRAIEVISLQDQNWNYFPRGGRANA